MHTPFKIHCLITMAGVALACTTPAQYSAVLLDTPAGFSSLAFGAGGHFAVGTAYGAANGNVENAVVWNSSTHAYTNLNPTGWSSSLAYGSGGNQVVGIGDGGNATFFSKQAILWDAVTGTPTVLAPNVVNGLQPVKSEALATNGSVQVGSVSVDGTNTFAAKWNGTAASMVQLHPSGYLSSTARGIAGNQIVGYGYGSATGNKNNALVWDATSGAYSVLTSGGNDNYALGTDGTHQVGYALNSTSIDNQALLWNGVGSNPVFLNPAGFRASTALATRNDLQVGYGRLEGPFTSNEALAWHGSAASVIRLNDSLSSMGWTITSSQATGIDENGNIFGFVFETNGIHAVEWQAVPEPATSAAIGLGMLGIVLRRRRSSLSGDMDGSGSSSGI